MKSIIVKVLLAVLGLGILFGVFNSNESITLEELQTEFNNRHLEFKEGYTFKTKEEIEAYKLELDGKTEDFSEYGFEKEDLKTNYLTTETISDYSKIITNEDAIEDVEALFFLLPRTYSAYNYFGGKENFDVAEDNIIATLNKGKEEITIQELNDLIINNLGFIEDIHFSIGNRRTYQADILKNKSYLTSQMIAEDFLLLKDSKGYYLKDGLIKKYLTAVDGDKDIEKYIFPTITERGEIKYTIAKLVEYSKIEEEIYVNSQVEIENSFGKISEMSVKLKYPNLNIISRPQMEGVVETISKDDVFIITVPNFIGENPLAYYNTVEEAKKHENVIIDIRGNSGGDDRYIIPWMEAFAEVDNVSEYMNYESLRLFTIIKTGFQGWQHYYNVSKNKNLIPNDKNIFIIYDKIVASTGENLLNKMANMENVVLVGTNSRGCSVNGNVGLYKLPNSELPCRWGNTLFFQEQYFMPEGVGATPDIVIPNMEDALDLTLKMIAYYEGE